MGSFLSCLSRSRRKSSERKPLLPTRHDDNPAPAPLLYKLADILGALQKGKLPSQDQLNLIWQNILRSGLLRDEIPIVSGHGSLSRSGRRVLDDTREIVEALLQIGLEKNADDKFQELIYRCFKIEGLGVHIETDNAIDAGRASLSQLHAQVPSPAKLSSDSSALLAALPSLLRLFLTSVFFRLLLSDVRQLLAGLAADVASVAAEVQIAAEEVEKAVDVDDDWFSIVEDKVSGAAQAIGKLDPGAEAQKTAKDIFIARVEELVVRAHRDPQTLLALQTIHGVISEYAWKISRAASVISAANTGSPSADSHSNPPQSPEITITPTPEVSQALEDLKSLLERLASRHSLDPLLRSLSDVAQAILGQPSNPINKDIRNFFHNLDSFLQRSLAPASHEPPQQTPNLYVRSREGKLALEELYERGNIIFSRDNNTSDRTSKLQWRTSFQVLLQEYDAYVSALCTDRSTAKLLQAVDNLRASWSEFLDAGFGMGVAGAKRKLQSQEEFLRDVVGWFIPRMGTLFLRLIPIPRLEFRTGKVEGALQFGSAGAGLVEVKSDLLPDSVALRSWNEVKADIVPASQGVEDNGRTVRTSTSNRIHIHFEGVRFSAHDLGYFVRYHSRWPWAEYVDRGLVSVDVGSSSAGGLGIDIELEIDSPAEPISQDDNGDQDLLPFRVVAVKSSLPGLTFTLSKSKHYILNKLFVQPLAGPLVSKIVTELLEEQLRKALVDLAVAWEEVRVDVRRKGGQEDEGSKEGSAKDYVEVGVKKIINLLRVNNEERETHTRLTKRGFVHTKTRVNATRDAGPGASADHDHDEWDQDEEVEETVIAVGAGAQLGPDEAGACDDDETDTRPLLEDVVEVVADRTQAVVGETRNAISTVEHAERRRKKRVRFEEIHVRDTGRGWRSTAFDI